MAVLDDPRQSQKRGRTRSPAYPYIALPNALEKAAVLWQVEGRHAAAVNVAMQHWGYKEDSSTGYSCVAALKKFGLVDHEGMGDTRQVKLSDLALTILLDKDPDSDERREALRTAALGPRIHAELWERYGAELPSDPSLKRYLVLERGFNEAAVDELLDEYKQTMTFAGLNVGTGAAGLALADLALEAERGNGAGGATSVTLAPVAPRPGGRDIPASGNGAGPAGGPRGNGGVATNRPIDRLATGEAGLAINSESWRPAQGAGNAAGGSVRPQNGREGFRQEAPVQDGLRGAERARDFEGTGQRQQGLFGGLDTSPETYPAEARAATSSSRAEEPPGREPAPWSMARKELPVPLDNDLVARVPYPMSEEDFELLIGTLQLWKKRLVQSDL